VSVLTVLPLAFVMIAGPQIITATLLATGHDARRNSLAFLAGAALAITAGTMAAYWVTGLLERAASPSGQGTVKTVIDWLVLVLFLFLMARTYRRRKTAEEPRWMGKLHTADAGFSFRLGLLLFLVMPTDIITMFTSKRALSCRVAASISGNASEDAANAATTAMPRPAKNLASGNPHSSPGVIMYVTSIEVPMPPSAVITRGSPVSSSTMRRNSPRPAPDARSSANGRRRSMSPDTVATVRLHATTTSTNAMAGGSTPSTQANSTVVRAASSPPVSVRSVAGCGSGPSKLAGSGQVRSLTRARSSHRTTTSCPGPDRATTASLDMRGASAASGAPSACTATTP
jgi:Sap, sulfolipid-1-addressing protein